MGLILIRQFSDFRHQLLDVLGFAQTMDSYTVVMNKIHFDDRKHEELSERYLWALSLSSQPNPEIILALLDKYKKVINMPGKVKETLVLTLGSMANRLAKLPHKPGNAKVKILSLILMKIIGIYCRL